MKWIKYNMKNSLLPVKMPWTEANEAIAKAEAHNGEITPFDDGQEEAVTPTLETRVATLEADGAEMAEALELILSGVTE